jgi:hypothetical protein
MAVFREALYPHARLLGPVLSLLRPRHFAADIEFVQNVAGVKRYREYFLEAQDFAAHPENTGFWRTKLHVRISSRRLRRLVRTTLHPGAGGGDSSEAHSLAPFDSKEAERVNNVTVTSRHSAV